MTTVPNPPKRNQDINFVATMLNTTNETRYFDFVVQLYDPNKPGSNQRFGESDNVSITVPPGISQVTAIYPGVRGGGGCISLYAQGEWQTAEKSRTPFNNTTLSPLAFNFDVCP